MLSRWYTHLESIILLHQTVCLNLIYNSKGIHAFRVTFSTNKQQETLGQGAWHAYGLLKRKENINPDYNTELKHKSEVLGSYTSFVEKLK